MPSNHLILCHPFLLLPSIFPSIRVFSNELALYIRWPKYWSFRFRISPSSEYLELFPLGLTGLISLLSKGLSRVFTNTTVQNHQFFGTQLSLWSNSHIHTSEMKLLSHVLLFVTPWTVAYQASPYMGFSRQEYWSGSPLPSPGDLPNPEVKNPGLLHCRQILYPLHHQGIS